MGYLSPISDVHRSDAVSEIGVGAFRLLHSTTSDRRNALSSHKIANRISANRLPARLRMPKPKDK
jgi:hypothetical protein